MTVSRERDMIFVEKRGMKIACAWIEPSGVVTNFPETTISSFESVYITLTDRDKATIRNASKRLNN
jgi:hypothetical protein